MAVTVPILDAVSIPVCSAKTLAFKNNETKYLMHECKKHVNVYYRKFMLENFVYVVPLYHQIWKSNN